MSTPFASCPFIGIIPTLLFSHLFLTMIIKNGLRIAIECCYLDVAVLFIHPFVDGFYTVGEVSVGGPLLGTFIIVPRAVCLEIMGFTGDQANPGAL